MCIKNLTPSISTEGVKKDKGDIPLGVSKSIIALFSYNSNKTNLIQDNLNIFKII
jgi:hypothetical protein